MDDAIILVFVLCLCAATNMLSDMVTDNRLSGIAPHELDYAIQPG